MSMISNEELRTLMDTQDETCVSMYLPTVKAGDQVQQNPIRFKNLVGEAQKKLVESGMRKAEASALLDKSRSLLDDAIFWQHQSTGLAVFLSDGVFQYYRLPAAFETKAVIGESFHLKPLLPFISENDCFYLLALSQNNVRLLEGTRDSIAEVELKTLPDSLAEALRWDDPEEHVQWNASRGASTGGARPDPNYHGHAVGEDDKKDDILRFFHKIDAGLQEYLGDDTAPLVLAGVEYLLPIYREANSYSYLSADGIIGNPERASEEELHEQAWEILQPVFARDRERAATRFQELGNQEQVSNDLGKIVPAAVYGKVDSLFLPRGVEVWGAFNPETGQIERHEESTVQNRDLLDLAAIHTHLNGGKVYLVERQDMPDGSLAAAIFRY